MFNKFKSRKFWVTVCTALIVSVSDQIGISPETTQWLVALAASYIIGQGAVDAAEKL